MATIQVIPHGIQHLAFSYDIPEDWKIADIPSEVPSFDDPKYFLPLAAAVSPCGNFAFTAGARIAYSDGTLLDWLQFLCGDSGIEIGNIEKWTDDQAVGVQFDARQHADGATIHMRNLYLEDGGRLFALSTMTSQPGLDLPEICNSFRLADSTGPTVPLAPTPEN